jgi:sugar/nucleoside kinase (ribokinase family)
MSAQVWCLGDAVVDLLPEGDGRLMQCGGAPANVAVGIARLEGKSGFIGRVGQDPFGKFMYDTLRQEKVNTDYMTFDEAQRTSTVVVALDDEGERSFTFMVRPSADLFLQADDLPAFRQGSGYTAVLLRSRLNLRGPRRYSPCSAYVKQAASSVLILIFEPISGRIRRCCSGVWSVPSLWPMWSNSQKKSWLS